jgi:hypothetical protein
MPDSLALDRIAVGEIDFASTRHMKALRTVAAAAAAASSASAWMWSWR